MQKKWKYTWVVTIMDAINKSHFAKVLWKNNSSKEK